MSYLFIQKKGQIDFQTLWIPGKEKSIPEPTVDNVSYSSIKLISTAGENPLLGKKSLITRFSSNTQVEIPVK